MAAVELSPSSFDRGWCWLCCTSAGCSPSCRSFCAATGMLGPAVLHMTCVLPGPGVAVIVRVPGCGHVSGPGVRSCFRSRGCGHVWGPGLRSLFTPLLASPTSRPILSAWLATNVSSRLATQPQGAIESMWVLHPVMADQGTATPGPHAGSGGHVSGRG